MFFFVACIELFSAILSKKGFATHIFSFIVSKLIYMSLQSNTYIVLATKNNNKEQHERT